MQQENSNQLKIKTFEFPKPIMTISILLIVISFITAMVSFFDGNTPNYKVGAFACFACIVFLYAAVK